MLQRPGRRVIELFAEPSQVGQDAGRQPSGRFSGREQVGHLLAKSSEPVSGQRGKSALRKCHMGFAILPRSEDGFRRHWGGTARSASCVFVCGVRIGESKGDFETIGCNGQGRFKGLRSVEAFMGIAEHFSAPVAESTREGDGFLGAQSDLSARDQAEVALESALLSVFFGFVAHRNGPLEMN